MSDGEIDRPVMSPESIEAAAGTARALVTYRYLDPADPGHPLPDGGFWGAFTESLTHRWERFKRDHETEPNTFDSVDADGQTRLVTDGGRERRNDLEQIADALELQNALLLQLVQDRERERVQEHLNPDHTGRSDRAIATDVVDAYGDLYGGSVAGWEFDPVSDRVENMGDSR